MTPTFEFQFEELPLHVGRKGVGALIDGAAEIEYDEQGNWGIEKIGLVTWRERLPGEVGKGRYVNSFEWLPMDDYIAATAHVRLLSPEFAVHIQDRVAAALEESRAGMIALHSYNNLHRSLEVM